LLVAGLILAGVAAVVEPLCRSPADGHSSASVTCYSSSPSSRR